jgi:hypothetical protein
MEYDKLLDWSRIYGNRPKDELAEQQESFHGGTGTFAGSKVLTTWSISHTSAYGSFEWYVANPTFRHFGCKTLILQ